MLDCQPLGLGRRFTQHKETQGSGLALPSLHAPGKESCASYAVSLQWEWGWTILRSPGKTFSHIRHPASSLLLLKNKNRSLRFLFGKAR